MSKIGKVLEVKNGACKRPFQGNTLVDLALCEWSDGMSDYDGRVICEILQDGSLKVFRHAFNKAYVTKLWKNFQNNA
jgi:hypothetical protein